MEAVAWPDPGDPGEAFRLPPGVPGPPLGLELTGEGGGGGATIEAPEAALRVGLGGLGGGPGGPGGNCGAMGRSGPVGGLKKIICKLASLIAFLTPCRPLSIPERPSIIIVTSCALFQIGFWQVVWVNAGGIIAIVVDLHVDVAEESWGLQGV